MRSSKLSIHLKAMLAISALLACATSALAQHETVLYNFIAGGHPNGVIVDAAGNLYGTTFTGGDHGAGAVFELSPAISGDWTETVLHSFDRKDGFLPDAAPVFDAEGNLYGTTFSGGRHVDGTVWELKPNLSGGWSRKTIHNFNLDGTDGADPEAPLIFDDAGNIFGTTAGGGAYFGGTVFEMTPKIGGGWTEQVLHSFGSGNDGLQVARGLVRDALGNLYGTTTFGGDRNGDCDDFDGCGIVFSLTPQSDGTYSETVLYTFTGGADGDSPSSPLIFDAQGNLYGTTAAGGTYGGGTVFELTPTEGGIWNETVLHNFGQPLDGSVPEGPLLSDSAGNIYGTTQRALGNSGITWGTAYVLFRKSWTEEILHLFGYGSNGGGAEPISGLVLGYGGNLYGAANAGGYADYGTIFEISH